MSQRFENAIKAYNGIKILETYNAIEVLNAIKSSKMP